MLTLALSLTALAALVDLRSGRIPNAITYPAIVFGLLLGLWPGGVGELGLGDRALGLALGFVPAFVLFVGGVLGGGDVKLLAAVGAIVGYPLVGEVLAYSCLVGAAIAIGVLVWKARLGDTLRGIAATAGMTWLGETAPPVPARDLRIPLGAAIFGGTVWTLVGPALGVALIG